MWCYYDNDKIITKKHPVEPFLSISINDNNDDDNYDDDDNDFDDVDLNGGALPMSVLVP